jgi:hypothetical protein
MAARNGPPDRCRGRPLEETSATAAQFPPNPDPGLHPRHLEMEDLKEKPAPVWVKKFSDPGRTRKKTLAKNGMLVYGFFPAGKFE